MILNNSTVQQALKCAYFIELQSSGLSVPEPYARARGSALHEARAFRLRAKMGNLSADAIDAYDVAKHWISEREIDDSSEPLRRNMNRDLELGVMADREFVDNLDPVLVEAEVIAQPAGRGFQIKGRIDTITRIKPTKFRVIDLKTTGRKPSPEAAMSSTQLTGYCLLSRATDFTTDEAELQYLCFAKEVTTDTQPAVRTLEDYQSFLDKVEAVAKQLEAGIMTPAVDGTWWCSRKWCKFYQICKYPTKQAKSVGLNIKTGGSDVIF